MATESGYCDIVLVNALGYVTVVECKLWKNPEGRRQVVAQTMDYAKDLSRMSYETFEKRCLDARGDQSESLFALVQERYPDADQTTFIDGVQRNLHSARIMLLVVGDGIRENTVELTEFLERHATLRFTFGLVELPVYRLDSENVLVTPRVIAKTLEIVRAVVVLDHGESRVLSEVDEQAVAQSSSETVFFDRLTQSRGTAVASGVRDLVNELRIRLGIVTKLGRGKHLSLNLKSANDGLNFGSIQQDGLVYFYGIVNKAAELGDRDVGQEYLDNLATIVDGSVDRSMKEWHWCVKKNGEYLQVDELLAKKSEMIEVIDVTLRKLSDDS